MTAEAGIALGFIGITLTIIGFYIAYRIGSKDSEPEKLTSVQQSLRDLWDSKK